MRNRSLSAVFGGNGSEVNLMCGMPWSKQQAPPSSYQQPKQKLDSS